MKSIRQISQLSEQELKGIINSDSDVLGRIVTGSLISSDLRTASESFARDIAGKLATAHQLIIERMISEEFFSMLEEAALEEKDTSRKGYYTMKVRTCLGDMEIEIPRARFLDFTTKFLKRYGHNPGDPGEKVMSLYRGGMSENDIVKALAEAEGMGVCASTIQKIVHTIEAINLKYKKETRKRILLNLEDNATIVIIVV